MMKKGVEKIAIGMFLNATSGMIERSVVRNYSKVPTGLKLVVLTGAMTTITILRFSGFCMAFSGTMDIADVVVNNYDKNRAKIIDKKKKVVRSFKKKMGKVVDFKRS